MNQVMQFLNNMHTTRHQLNRLHGVMQVIEAQLVPVTADTPVSVIYRLSDLIEAANALQKKLMEQHFSSPSIAPNQAQPFQPGAMFHNPVAGNYRHPAQGSLSRDWMMRHVYTYDDLLIDLGDKEKNTVFMDFHFKLLQIHASNDFLLIFGKKLENKISSEDLSFKIRTGVLSFDQPQYNARVKARMVDGSDRYIDNIQEFKDWISAWWNSTPSSVAKAPSEMIDTSDTIGTTIKNLLSRAGEPVTLTGLLFWINYSKNNTLESTHSHVRVPRFKLSLDNSVDGRSLLSANLIPGPDMTLAEAAQEFEQTIYYSHSLMTWQGYETADGKRIVYLKKQFEDYGDQPGVRLTDPRQYFEWLIELNSVKHSSAAPETSFTEKVAEPTADKKPVTLKQLFSFINKVRKSRTSDGIKVPNFKILGVVNQGKAILHIVPEKGAYIDLINICNRFQTYMTSNRLLTTNGNLLSRVKSLDVYLVKPGTTSEDQSNVKMLTDPEDFFGWVKSQGK